MKRTRVVPTLFAVLSVVSLAGCASSVPDAAETEVVHFHADYPPYDQVSLIRDAVLIVEGTVVSVSPTTMAPRIVGDTGTEEANPFAGLSEEELRVAEGELRDAGIPGALVTVKADAVIKGEVRPGEEFVILQTGGVQDGVEYRNEHAPILTPSDTYLIFAQASLDGRYAIVGGPAGMYRAQGDGRFSAVVPDMAPFATVDAEQVAALVHAS